MTYRSSRLRFALHSLLVTCVAVAAMPVHAETPPSREALMGLARGFVERVGSGFENADRYLATILPDDMRADENFVDIPDGEVLLLQINLGGTRLSDTIMGIKQGRDVMLSLRDFVTIARFAIDVRSEEGLADGWFIREQQKFVLDTKAGKVAAGDRNYDIAPGDVLVQDGDIYVRGQTLGKWLDFSLKIKFSDQMARIDSGQKWPVQQQLERRARRQPSRESPPQLPRDFVDYTAASIPNIDFDLQQRYRRSGDTGKGDASTSYTMTGAGDFLGHTTTAVLTGSDEERLAAARVTFSKESDKAELLGPLKARKYEFGDISPSRVPVAGPGRAGLGMRVTDGLGNIVSGAVTEIIGDAQPGWDVELSRNGLIMALVTAGSDGRYVFDDVPLNAGENIFVVTQYGPLGETKEENRRIVSSANLASGDRTSYDVSVTAADTEIWSKDDEDTADQGNPQLSALYEMQLSPEMTAGVGVQSVTQSDDRKDYVYAGMARSFGGLLLNLNSAYDLDGSVAGDLSGRFRLLGQAIGGTLSYTGEDYGAVNGNTSPASYSLRTTGGGQIYESEKLQVHYTGTSDYTFVDDGSKIYDSTFNVSAAVPWVTFGQGFHDIRQQDALGNDLKSTTGTTTVRSAVAGTRVRANANYSIKPEYELQNYGVDLSRRLTRDLRGSIGIEHKPGNRYTEGEASLSWNAGRVLLSPKVTYDSDNNLGASLSLRTSLSYDPATGKTAMTGRGLTNSGGFSAFVFLDKDGDKKYTEGVDEVVEGASLRAVQAHQLAITDEDGEAFIYSLPAGRATDVLIEENSLPDAYWVSAFEGVSVLPRPGFTAHAEFPLHMAGEIDGTLRARRADGNMGPLPGVNVYLYNGEGRKVREAATAVDGFYLFDRVSPGRYLLMIDDEDAKRYKISRPPPQEINIGYEGTMIYGNDITLQSGGDDVPVGFASGVAAYLAANPHITQQDIAGGTVLLNLGSYRSQLLMGVVWYRIQQRYAGLVGGGRLLVKPSQSFAVPKTGFHELLVEMPGVKFEDAFGRCRALAARGLTCGVEIIPPQGLKAAQAQGVGSDIGDGVN